MARFEHRGCAKLDDYGLVNSLCVLCQIYMIIFAHPRKSITKTLLINTTNTNHRHLNHHLSSQTASSTTTTTTKGFSVENFQAPERCKVVENADQQGHHNNKSDKLRLFTIVYGLLGMPVFIYSVCRVGDLLSLSTMNIQLRFVHYAIKIPFYLVRQLIRAMCCLCCCCYCCGVLAITTQSIFLVPCLRPQKPKLTLYKPLLVSALQSKESLKDDQSLKSTSKKRQADKKVMKLKQKSVRFSPIHGDSTQQQQQQQRVTQNDDVIEIGSSGDHDQSQDFNDHDIEWQKRLFRQASSGQLVVANLFIMIIYLLIGAFFHSKYKQQTFVTGLFSSYKLVTTSANQFLAQSPNEQSQNGKQSNNNQAEDRKQLITMSLYDGDFFALFECLYLWVGLNLMSCFMRAVLVKFDCWRRLYTNIATTSDQNDNNNYNDDVDKPASYANCNGHVPMQLMGTMQQRQTNYSQAAPLNRLNMVNSIGDSGKFAQTANYLPEHSVDTQTSSAPSCNNNTSIVQNNGSPGSSTLSYHPAIVQSSVIGQQPPVAGFSRGELAELYVVDDNQHFAPTSHSHGNHLQHQQQDYGLQSSFKMGHSRQRSVHDLCNKQPSDISLSVSSAATTEKSSVCLNHLRENEEEFEASTATCRLIGPPSMRLVGQSPQQGPAFMLTDGNCYIDQDESRSANSRLVSSSSSQSLSAHHRQQILNSQDQQLNGNHHLHQANQTPVTNNFETSTCAIRTLDRKTNKHNNITNNLEYSGGNQTQAGSISTLRPRQTNLSNHKTFCNNSDHQ